MLDWGWSNGTHVCALAIATGLAWKNCCLEQMAVSPSVSCLVGLQAKGVLEGFLQLIAHLTWETLSNIQGNKHTGTIQGVMLMTVGQRKLKLAQFVTPVHCNGVLRRRGVALWGRWCCS